jgi:hypothetical protein
MTCRLLALASSAAIVIAACGGEAESAPGGQAGAGACSPGLPPSRTISCVASFTPGDGAGFGQQEFPQVIYGEPKGLGTHQGSTDVLSLGKGGVIVVGFGVSSIVDEDGTDFVVFENAFYANDDPTKPFAELAEVSVSEDGATWKTFPCHSSGYPYDGCAGWHAVFANPAKGISPFDPDAGGDPFDLADIGVASARYIRIHDISNYGGAPSAGFDLDAAALLHAR